MVSSRIVVFPLDEGETPDKINDLLEDDHRELGEECRAGSRRGFRPRCSLLVRSLSMTGRHYMDTVLGWGWLLSRVANTHQQNLLIKILTDPKGLIKQVGSLEMSSSECAA